MAEIVKFEIDEFNLTGEESMYLEIGLRIGEALEKIYENNPDTTLIVNFTEMAENLRNTKISELFPHIPNIVWAENNIPKINGFTSCSGLGIAVYSGWRSYKTSNMAARGVYILGGCCSTLGSAFAGTAALTGSLGLNIPGLLCTSLGGTFTGVSRLCLDTGKALEGEMPRSKNKAVNSLRRLINYKVKKATSSGLGTTVGFAPISPPGFEATAIMYTLGLSVAIGVTTYGSYRIVGSVYNRSKQVVIAYKKERRLKELFNQASFLIDYFRFSLLLNRLNKLNRFYRYYLLRQDFELIILSM